MQRCGTCDRGVQTTVKQLLSKYLVVWKTSNRLLSAPFLTGYASILLTIGLFRDNFWLPASGLAASGLAGHSQLFIAYFFYGRRVQAQEPWLGPEDCNRAHHQVHFTRHDPVDRGLPGSTRTLRSTERTGPRSQQRLAIVERITSTGNCLLPEGMKTRRNSRYP